MSDLNVAFSVATYKIAAVYDFDGDGDLDVVGTEGVGVEKNCTFVWACNDGKGNFKILKNINYTGTGDFLQGCTVARFGDELRVALSWHRDGGGIHALNVPADPVQTTWTSTLLSTTVSSPPQGEDLDHGDFDRDGDPDVVIGEHRGKLENRVVLFENVNAGAAWKPNVIDTGPKDTIDHHDGTQAVDLDGDGDLDIISIGWYNPKVWVYENKR